jgi:dihydrofolate synthase/folylpolyglutamate synthase
VTQDPSSAALLERLEQHGIRLGLETTHQLLSSLGNPESGFPSVLIAGTNGKGSTAVQLASMIAAAGYRSGLYTSPHLEDITERIRVDGAAVSAELFSSTLSRVVEKAEKALGHLPTYFEAVTAAAFLIFAEQEVDLAVMEVGLGGRLDATNACEPALSLITEIGLEHRQYLGESLSSIAREKAGILRQGRPAWAWVERDEAWEAIRAVGSEVGAELHRGPEAARLIETTPLGWEGQVVQMETSLDSYLVRTPLLGAHQVKNLALATLGAEGLRELGWNRIDRQAIERGAGSSHWPGRLERVELPGGRTVILDVAHNADGAATLAGFLKAALGRFDLIFGVLADKEVSTFLPSLARDAGKVILTAPTSSRSMPVDRLAPLLPDRDVEIEADPAVALRRALEDGDDPLVICGSVYLVGELRTELRRRFGLPPPASAQPCWNTQGLDLPSQVGV